MIDKIKNISFLKANVIAGVEVIISSSNSYSFSFMLLRRQKDNIKIELREEEINDFDELKKKLSTSIPIIISIDGKGILHKFVKIEKKEENTSIINQVLPNSSILDFYIQKVNTSENEKIIASIARKGLIDDLLEMFSKNKFHVIDLYLGPFIVNIINSIVAVETIKTKLFLLQFENNQIVNFEKTDSQNENYLIGTETINSNEIVSFSSSMSYFALNDNITSIIHPEIIKAKDEAVFKRFFTIFGWGFLIFFFSLLFINYLFFNSYSSKFNDLSAQIDQNKNYISLLDTLKKQYQFQQQLFSNNGYLSNTRFSFFADRLALLLPANISLTTMQINPLLNKPKNNEEVSFQRNRILIRGIANNSFYLNEWINKLKIEKWISEVKILDYKYEKTENNGEFAIEIKIEI